jgi:hypothetical protein
VRPSRPWFWTFAAISALAFVTGWLSYEGRGLGTESINLPSPLDILIPAAGLVLPLLWVVLFVVAIARLRKRALLLAISAPVAMFWLVADLLPVPSGCTSHGLFPCGT